MITKSDPKRVFINCPFDKDYLSILETITFCIINCGFLPVTASLERDSGEIRVRKITRLIKSCRYGIHDISRTELSTNKLPRFNMPFELGLDLGCRYFGSDTYKRHLILDKSKFRFQKFISDISGQDVAAHNNSPDTAMREVRDWLETNSGKSSIPGPEEIRRRYKNFLKALPKFCTQTGFKRKKLPYYKYVEFAQAWVKSGS